MCHGAVGAPAARERARGRARGRSAPRLQTSSQRLGLRELVRIATHAGLCRAPRAAPGEARRALMLALSVDFDASGRRIGEPSAALVRHRRACAGCRRPARVALSSSGRSTHLCADCFCAEERPLDLLARPDSPAAGTAPFDKRSPLVRRLQAEWAGNTLWRVWVVHQNDNDLFEPLAPLTPSEQPSIHLIERAAAPPPADWQPWWHNLTGVHF